VCKYTLVILGVVEVELILVSGEVSPNILFGGVFVEFGEVRRDAGMEAADDVIEYFFLVAELLVGVAEAVVLVDEFPDVGAVVVGEGLDVGMYVEVLALIVGLILNVPNPPVLAVAALILPKVQVVEVRLDLLRVGPKLRNVLVVASADGAALTLANLVHGAELALLVYVQPNYPEVLGLHQMAQRRRRPLVYLFEGFGLEPRALLQQHEACPPRCQHQHEVPDIHH
jgi:hypothetical protein